ncbi:hypothetical protein GP486_004819 [Trichoglossum hirsutum]|uniref:Heterokaryon incompatibility domain-containing protein n=1 Tax=Trichoglossum hirsutum TaxID=265104 RepID=A0A9P8LAF1_9PEZI|nr:hypothetical protein GP486_004819 [Trichoglossum hirsutum]
MKSLARKIRPSPRNKGPSDKSGMFANASRPHSCKECEKLLVDLAAPNSNQRDTLDGVVVSMSLFDARAAFLNGCDLIRWIFEEWLKGTWPENHYLDLKFTFVIRGDIFNNTSEISVSVGDQFSDEHLPASAALFEVTAYQGDPAADWIVRRPPLSLIPHELMFCLARRWINACVDDHEQCSSQNPNFTPTRLIDVGEIGDDLLLYLHETPEVGVNYTAMSYCWGGNQPVKTIKSTFKENCRKIEFSSLPKTLQDAVTCTRNLEYRYLWVDSLCIIQDDPDDVAREIATMPSVFGEASVTICAASATDCKQGFLQNWQHSSTDDTYRWTLPFRSPQGKKGTILLSYNRGQNGYSINAIPKDHICTRAWTLQETLLARRMLVFRERDVRWTCRGIDHLDEWCMPLFENAAQDYDIRNYHPAGELKSPFTDRLISRDGILYEFIALVTLYTSRKLSLYEDRLTAISAVAKTYSGTIQARYLAGLWDYNLVTQLLWQRGEDYEGLLKEGEETPPNWSQKRYDYYVKRARPRARFATFVAPSWSWASCPESLDYRDPEDYSAHASAIIIECEVEPLYSSAPFGAVKSGYLKIKGRLLRTTLRCSSMTEVGVYTYSIWEGADNMPGGQLIHDAFEPDWLPNSIVDAWCLEIVPEVDDIEFSPLGLILQSAGEGFKIIGSFRYPRWWKNREGVPQKAPKRPWPWEPEPRTVTII